MFLVLKSKKDQKCFLLAGSWLLFCCQTKKFHIPPTLFVTRIPWAQKFGDPRLFVRFLFLLRRQKNNLPEKLFRTQYTNGYSVTSTGADKSDLELWTTSERTDWGRIPEHFTSWNDCRASQKRWNRSLTPMEIWWRHQKGRSTCEQPLCGKRWNTSSLFPVTRSKETFSWQKRQKSCSRMSEISSCPNRCFQ